MQRSFTKRLFAFTQHWYLPRQLVRWHQNGPPKSTIILSTRVIGEKGVCLHFVAWLPRRKPNKNILKYFLVRTHLATATTRAASCPLTTVLRHGLETFWFDNTSLIYLTELTPMFDTITRPSRKLMAIYRNYQKSSIFSAIFSSFL